MVREMSPNPGLVNGKWWTLSVPGKPCSGGCIDGECSLDKSLCKNNFWITGHSTMGITVPQVGNWVTAMNHAQSWFPNPHVFLYSVWPLFQKYVLPLCTTFGGIVSPPTPPSQVTIRGWKPNVSASGGGTVDQKHSDCLQFTFINLSLLPTKKK